MKRIQATLLLLIILILTACTSPPAIPENDTWKLVSRTPALMAEGDAVVLDGLIYVAGGFTEQAIRSYDPISGRWKTGADMPEMRHHLQSVAFDGLIYVFGGADQNPANLIYQPNDNVWVYDPAADHWTVLDPMPEGRATGDAVVVGDYVYLVGGVGPSKAVLRYDPATDSWQRLAESAVSRDHVAAAVIGHQIYLIGGRWGKELTMSSVEIYDIETDTWTTGVPMNEVRSATANFVYDGKIYVSGGEVLHVEEPYALATVTVFDPAADQWTYSEEMPSPLHGHQIVMIGSQVYVIGGLAATPEITYSEAVYVMELEP